MLRTEKTASGHQYNYRGEVCGLVAAHICAIASLRPSSVVSDRDRRLPLVGYALDADQVQLLARLLCRTSASTDHFTDEYAEDSAFDEYAENSAFVSVTPDRYSDCYWKSESTRGGGCSSLHSRLASSGCRSAARNAGSLSVLVICPPVDLQAQQRSLCRPCFCAIATDSSGTSSPRLSRFIRVPGVPRSLSAARLHLGHYTQSAIQTTKLVSAQSATGCTKI
ncbi:hypothetical protein V1515DRAFT_585868 [Lipomyces mesembrius]